MTNRDHETLHRTMAEAREDLLYIHRRLIQVPSVNLGDGSSASEDAVAEIARDYLHGSGVAAHAVEDAPGRTNFIAWTGARDPDGLGLRETEPHAGGRTLLLMSHADVVPAGDESAWTHPPFLAVVEDGRVWGRGANDCKMLAACELFLLRVFARLGLPRAGGVRMVMGADEEAGGRWGFGRLAERHAHWLRADLAVNEGGGAFLGENPRGERIFSLGCGEKGRCEVVLQCEGQGAHASTPWGRINPLAELARAAARLDRWSAEPVLASPIFDELHDLLGLDSPVALETLESALAHAGKRSTSLHHSLRAQSRMTLVPTVFRSGEKSNALPSRAELRCDTRLLPGQNLDVLESTLRSLLRDLEHVSFRIEQTAASSVSPLDDSTRKHFEAALERTFGSDPPCRVMPNWCTGFTDSRFVRSVGTPTYGFQVVDPGADPDRLGIHCIDESIEVDMLLPCAQALGHFALDFCTAETPP